MSLIRPLQVLLFPERSYPMPAPPLFPSRTFAVDGETLSQREFEAKFSFRYYPGLIYASQRLYANLCYKHDRLHAIGELSIEQMWMGRYFFSEIKGGDAESLEVRYISPQVGYGLFASSPFLPNSWIGIYSGRVRRSSLETTYAFEHVMAPGIPTKYCIDGEYEGGLVRFINHSSDHPNVRLRLATVEKETFLILTAMRRIERGEQLLYNYGPAYWEKRGKPALFS